MNSKNVKTIKSINMPLDKCEIFLTMENEEVGEMVKYLLEYAINGTEPSFRNKWQKIVYGTFASDIKHQKASYESRRNNCASAKANANKTKSGRKTSSKVPEVTEVTTTDVDEGDVTSPASTEVEQEDLTYIAFISLYEKKDSGNYDTEAMWNSLTDEDKRGALAYIKENLVDKVHSFRREYPSKFLTNHPWK